jgi:hypothetical protein
VGLDAFWQGPSSYRLRIFRSWTEWTWLYQAVSTRLCNVQAEGPQEADAIPDASKQSERPKRTLDQLRKNKVEEALTMKLLGSERNLRSRRNDG